MKQGNLFEDHLNTAITKATKTKDLTSSISSLSSRSKKEIIDTGFGQIIFIENGLTARAANRLLEYLTENDKSLPSNYQWKNKQNLIQPTDNISFTTTAWKQDHIKLYGKFIPLPRLTSWYGDYGMNYTYSGIPCTPNYWNKGLSWLKEKAEIAAEYQFNSALLNWYRDGSDTISWHADDEKELGQHPTIASISLGETRDFILRKKKDHSCKLKFALSHGSILIMKGELQQHWEHSLPARKRVEKSRINITFRRIFS